MTILELVGLECNRREERSLSHAIQTLKLRRVHACHERPWVESDEERKEVLERRMHSSRLTANDSDDRAQGKCSDAEAYSDPKENLFEELS